MLKKLLIIFLVLVALFAVQVCGCAKDKPKEDNKIEETQESQDGNFDIGELPLE